MVNKPTGGGADSPPADDLPLDDTGDNTDAPDTNSPDSGFLWGAITRLFSHIKSWFGLSDDTEQSLTENKSTIMGFLQEWLGPKLGPLSALLFPGYTAEETPEAKKQKLELRKLEAETATAVATQKTKEAEAEVAAKKNAAATPVETAELTGKPASEHQDTFTRAKAATTPLEKPADAGAAPPPPATRSPYSYHNKPPGMNTLPG